MPTPEEVIGRVVKGPGAPAQFTAVEYGEVAVKALAARGYVIVPVEPTEEMEEACWKALPYAVYSATQTVITAIPKNVYEAMLAAAPNAKKPPQPEGEAAPD